MEPLHLDINLVRKRKIIDLRRGKPQGLEYACYIYVNIYIIYIYIYPFIICMNDQCNICNWLTFIVLVYELQSWILVWMGDLLFQVSNPQKQGSLVIGVLVTQIHHTLASTNYTPCAYIPTNGGIFLGYLWTTIKLRAKIAHTTGSQRWFSQLPKDFESGVPSPSWFGVWIECLLVPLHPQWIFVTIFWGAFLQSSILGGANF